MDLPLVHQLYGNLSDVTDARADRGRLLQVPSQARRPPARGRRSSATRPDRVGPLFLGFRLDDWDFRVFFQFLRSREGRDLHGLLQRRDIAVQIDPEDGRTRSRARVREYLESYFESENTDIYWGSTEEFLQELHEQWQRDRTMTGEPPRRCTRSTSARGRSRRTKNYFGRDREAVELAQPPRRRANRPASLALRCGQNLARPGRTAPPDDQEGFLVPEGIGEDGRVRARGHPREHAIGGLATPPIATS